MTSSEIISFVLMAGVAAYVQTLTGFAFGLLLMGGVGLTAVMPLRDAAVVTGVLTLVNATIMMTKGWRDVLRAELVLVLFASLPTLVGGYFLLDHLATNGLVYLRIILGAVIIISALQLVMPPKKEEKEATKSSFVFFGAFSGIMSGLFSTSGPPLVYHFYRQPLPIAAIRETLVAIFAINALIRLLVVIADGTFPKPVYWPAFLAVATVAAGTQMARRLPLPLSPRVLRLIVFLLLCASGASLALPAIPQALAGS
ncbi:sulfite exporter TauE/SafE family protein [Neorhizobium sp. P12A]|uniref:sulfite exporter TauE/SafE family protein n=1 Tax=Rhizobium/Agrobacterium group TaxID=227290 RepID=UPI001043228B|nr:MULTISPECIES: sulfite exporter TauE/SafE family protein [Rhizobium/Agrobacterium group]KAA0697142.1 sulfite exporter TauE/SafE family protein [Neorhizobium sp. P12A]TCR86011.1 sulfite exporter TauE/SafE [Rhizobium sp. BK376]